MNRRGKFIYFILLAALVLALPASALANKRIYKARLTTGAELHEVLDSNARGSAVFALAPDGMSFMVSVRGLSGPAVGAHIHAPAGVDANAPVVISLCGNPAPSATGACVTDADGNLTMQGEIGPSLLSAWGVSAAQLLTWFDEGSAYVNVHTSLNPAGETRGQIASQ